MPTAWNDITLCTASDIEAEIASLEIPAMMTGKLAEGAVQRAMVAAKDQIRQHLKGSLPEIYVSTASMYGYSVTYNSWLATNGYSYTDLDAILDEITNPEELRNAAVAFTIRALLFSSMFTFRAGYQETPTLLDPLYDRVNKMCTERLKLGVKLLQLDLNQDGVVSDHERPRSQKTIWKV